VSDADVDQPGDDVIMRRDVTDRDDDDDGDDVAVCGRRCCWPVRDVTAGRRLDSASDRRADDPDHARLAGSAAGGGSRDHAGRYVIRATFSLDRQRGSLV